MRFGDGHLAVASVGKRELAGEDTGTRNALFGHWKNLGMEIRKSSLEGKKRQKFPEE